MGDSLGEQTQKRTDGKYHFHLLEVILIAIVPLVWLFGILLFFTLVENPEKVRELPSLLFGASSLALFGFSFMVAVAAIFGWRRLENYIDRRVQEEVQKHEARTEKEMTGRIYSGMGFTLGRLSRRLDCLTPERSDLLDAAIFRTGQGLEKLEEIESSHAETSRNNLTFYLSLRGCTKDARQALSQRDEMLREGRHSLNTNRHLTYCLATLRYSRDAAERTEALEIVREIAASDHVTPAEKAEARLYLKAEEVEELAILQ